MSLPLAAVNAEATHKQGLRRIDFVALVFRGRRRNYITIRIQQPSSVDISIFLTIEVLEGEVGLNLILC